MDERMLSHSVELSTIHSAVTEMKYENIEQPPLGCK